MIMTRSPAASFAMNALPTLAICMVLSGCATAPADCDPTQADFFNNTSCLASGAYRQRQRDLESTLSSEQSRNRAFKTLLADLETEKAAARSDLQAQQAAYARAQANWREIKRGLAAESNKKPALATRVRQIDENLAAIESDKRAERDSLANQVKLLQQELDAGIYD